MSLESAIYQILINANSSAGSRVYPRRMPDNPTFPLIVYNAFDPEPVVTRSRLSAFSDTPGGTADYYTNESSLDRVRVSLDYAGVTNEQIRVLETEIRPFIEGFKGVSDGETLSIIPDTGSGYIYQSPENIHHRITDVICWHHR